MANVFQAESDILLSLLVILACVSFEMNFVLRGRWMSLGAISGQENTADVRNFPNEFVKDFVVPCAA